MTQMPVITGLLAKILNIVERLLQEWVDLQVTGVSMGNAQNPYINECAPYVNMSCKMTTCGTAFVEILEDVVHNALVMVSQSLVALISWETFPLS